MAPGVAGPLAQELARQLSAIGINLKVSVLPQDEFYRRWSSESLLMVVLGWSYSNGDASSGLAPLFHTPRNGWGTFNLGGYASTSLDEIIERSERTLDPTRRAQVLSSAMQLMRDDLPVIPLVTRPGLFAVRDDVVWTPTHDRVHAADLASR